MTRTMSASGRAALVQREGCRLHAYRDSVGVWTIGVGHTGRAAPPAVTPGMAITRREADVLLAADLAPFEAAVAAVVRHAASQNQFDAMVSLAFNIGAVGFAGSTVVHKLNEGDVAAAADAFLMWVHPPELHARRTAERVQFLTPDHVTSAAIAGAAPALRGTRPPSWWDRLRAALSFRKAA